MTLAKASLFFTLVFTVLMLAHVYLWVRVVRDTRLAGRPRRIATWAIGLAAALLVPIWMLSRVLPREFLVGPSVVAFTWKGLLYYALLILLIFEVVRCAARLVGKGRAAPREPGDSDAGAGGESVSRRAFLARSAAGSAAVGSMAISSVGITSALNDVETPETPIKLAKLPPALSGTRIAVISDVHLGPVLGEDFVRRIVEKTNSLKPDLVALTGDLVDGNVRHLAHDVAPLADLKSRYGTYFITGNHEYYSGVEEWLEHMPKLGATVLDNRRVTIGDAGARFELAGVHDYRGASVNPAYPPDMARALAGRDPDLELVLLAHQPVHVTEAAENGVGLQISGHTHGGQIWPFGLLAGLTQPYIKGLHRHTPETQIYVTRGTGFWGPPMRVLAPAEISLLVLTA
jgi:predicted MPP superfamily phosphohydrolase